MMMACSRFWMAVATSLGGLLRLAEHCCIVSSLVRREAQSAGAVGKAAWMTASARARSGCCCASAGAAATESARIAFGRRMAVSLTLQSGCGDLAALGLLGQEGDQRNARVGSELQLRHAHLPVAV